MALHAATLPKISTLLPMSLTMLPLDSVSKPEMVMSELLVNDVSLTRVTVIRFEDPAKGVLWSMKASVNAEALASGA